MVNPRQKKFLLEKSTGVNLGTKGGKGGEAKKKPQGGGGKKAPFKGVIMGGTKVRDDASVELGESALSKQFALERRGWGVKIRKNH